MMEKEFLFIAGPCAVESKEQIIRIAKELKKIGVDVLRGGTFKPRTNPKSFQGLQDEGIKYLLEAKKVTGLPIITELLTIEQVKKYADKIDIIQIGSRNMYNYELLKEVGKLLKNNGKNYYTAFHELAQILIAEKLSQKGYRVTLEKPCAKNKSCEIDVYASRRSILMIILRKFGLTI